MCTIYMLKNTVKEIKMFMNWKTQCSSDVPVFPQSIYRLNPNPVKIQAVIFVDKDKLILKFTQECKRIKVTNSFEEEKQS